MRQMETKPPFSENSRPFSTAQYLETLRAIMAAFTYREPIPDDQLGAWVKAVEASDDFWSRTHLAQLIAHQHRRKSLWGSIVVGWLEEAARRRSAWLSSLFLHAVQGWPEQVLTSPLMETLAQRHPAGLAEGLLQAVQASVVAPKRIEDAWLRRMVDAVQARPLLEWLAVARLLKRIRPSVDEWGMVLVRWMPQFAQIDRGKRAELLALLLSGWPMLTTSPHVLRLLRTMERSAREAFAEAVRRRWLKPHELPVIFRSWLVLPSPPRRGHGRES